nr:MAG TPA: hypothetical protein [Caudoviricetes sp.]
MRLIAVRCFLFLFFRLTLLLQHLTANYQSFNCVVHSAPFLLRLNRNVV